MKQYEEDEEEYQQEEEDYDVEMSGVNEEKISNGFPIKHYIIKNNIEKVKEIIKNNPGELTYKLLEYSMGASSYNLNDKNEIIIYLINYLPNLNFSAKEIG